MSEDARQLITIGASIRTMRKAKGWTLADLSRESGEPLNNIARYERGENEPGALALLRIARALGTTCEQLSGSQRKTRQLADV